MALRALHLVKTSAGASWAYRQMRELKKLGIDVHVAAPDGPLIPLYEKAGVKVHIGQCDISQSALGRIPDLLSRFKRLVSGVGPDIIHSHFVGTSMTMRLAMGRHGGPPRIFQVPGPLHLEHRFFRVAEILTAGSSDYWIGSCRWTCDRYKSSGVKADRIFLSYYGGDLSELVTHERGKLRHELGLSADTPIVGMVAYMYGPKRYLGQLHGLKGHEDLIDAMTFVAAKVPNAVCVMVGSAAPGAEGYEKRVRCYAQRRASRVVFLGHRNDVPMLYPDFDVAVHPSHSENLGGALESLLLRIPTVATDTGGFRDIVIPGRTGWLVPPRRPEKLGAAIVDAILGAERARQFAVAGRSLALSLLNVQRTAAEVKQVYLEVLRRHANSTSPGPAALSMASRVQS